MDEAEIDSKRFLSIFDKTNDWMMTKVEYGPIEKLPPPAPPKVKIVEKEVIVEKEKIVKV